MYKISALLAGAIFGLGLMLSGMTDTTKVRGFLDLFGAWDPTLMFVMGGAILPMLLAWRIAKGMGHSVSGAALPAAPRSGIDRDLILGALLFGAGWGLVGLCPGPALASLSYGGWQGGLFVLAMVGAMVSIGIIRNKA